jgi:hypothetical protein
MVPASAHSFGVARRTCARPQRSSARQVLTGAAVSNAPIISGQGPSPAIRLTAHIIGKHPAASRSYHASVAGWTRFDPTFVGPLVSRRSHSIRRRPVRCPIWRHFQAKERVHRKLRRTRFFRPAHWICRTPRHFPTAAVWAGDQHRVASVASNRCDYPISWRTDTVRRFRQVPSSAR